MVIRPDRILDHSSDHSRYLVITFIFILSSSLVSCQNNSSEVPYAQPVECVECMPYTLVWSDEFTQLNSSKWTVDSGCPGLRNTALQCYTKHNIVIREGILNVEIRIGSWDDPLNSRKLNFTSGQLISRTSWLYGMFEIRARMPKGKHLWPLVTLVPVENIYGNPSLSGKIIFLAMSGQDTKNFVSMVRYGPSELDIGSEYAEKTVSDPDLSSEFHVYSLEWTKSSMVFSFDREKYLTFNMSEPLVTQQGTKPYNRSGMPFDRRFRLVLSVPVDVHSDSLSVEEAKLWERPVMQVDWIRIFRRRVSSSSVTVVCFNSGGMSGVRFILLLTFAYLVISS